MTSPTPDPRAYELMYLRFLTIKRASKDLNHASHEPKPELYGLSDKEAGFIRVRMEREFNRSK